MGYSCIQGDLLDDMEIDITTVGAPKDLTSALAINLNWLRPDGTSALVPLIAIDLVGGRMKRVWSAGDTAIVGAHRGQVVITWPSSKPQTFPIDGSFIIWWVYAKVA